MSPDSWQEIKLGEVSRPRQWPTIRQSNFTRDGFPVYGANGQIGFYHRYTHSSDTVAITCRGATCGNVHLVPAMSYITGNAMALDDLNESRVIPRFLTRALVQRGLDDCVTGTAQPQIIGSALRRANFSCPPLPEQRRIAEILDTVDEAIRKTEEVIAKLEQMKQGLLHDLLTRGIDENGELRDPKRHHEQFKDSPLGRIPREWEVHQLVDVARIQSGIAKNSKRTVSDPILVHYLRVANVQDGYLDLSEMNKLRVSGGDIERYAVLPGDVLMNEGGDLDKLGRGAVWRGEYAPCVHQNHVFVVRPGPAILSDFLNAWTGSPAARRYFMVAGKQTTNLASINKSSLGKLPVLLPASDEQERIVGALRALEVKIEEHELEQQKLGQTKRGLMDDLLTGRVRVSLDEETDR